MCSCNVEGTITNPPVRPSNFSSMDLRFKRACVTESHLNISSLLHKSYPHLTFHGSDLLENDIGYCFISYAAFLLYFLLNLLNLWLLIIEHILNRLVLLYFVWLMVLDACLVLSIAFDDNCCCHINWLNSFFRFFCFCFVIFVHILLSWRASLMLPSVRFLTCCIFYLTSGIFFYNFKFFYLFDCNRPFKKTIWISSFRHQMFRI